MADKEFFVGTVGPLLYEDTDVYPDSEPMEAFRGPQVYLENAPTEAYHAARLADVASPGGSDTQVQFNDGGAFGGHVGMTFAKATGHLSVDAIPTSDHHVVRREDLATYWPMDYWPLGYWP